MTGIIPAIPAICGGLPRTHAHTSMGTQAHTRAFSDMDKERTNSFVHLQMWELMDGEGVFARLERLEARIHERAREFPLFHLAKACLLKRANE